LETDRDSSYVSKARTTLCFWILTPGGQVGGFQGVTLIFTHFLLTSEDAVSMYSCFDMNYTDLPTASTFKGSTVPAPFMSNTGVVLVRITRGLQTFATSAGFIASFAGTPLASTGLQVSVWYHIASIINPRSTYTLEHWSVLMSFPLNPI